MRTVVPYLCILIIFKNILVNFFDSLRLKFFIIAINTAFHFKKKAFHWNIFSILDFSMESHISWKGNNQILGCYAWQFTKSHGRRLLENGKNPQFVTLCVSAIIKNQIQGIAGTNIGI